MKNRISFMIWKNPLIETSLLKSLRILRWILMKQ